ncbi:protein ROOT HAIR DEFECTIVE 3-like [Rhododendron vialii]|uniref:protein ROOT HAIR DEFECTIVE 3-like n=1 Tax=Rhododendron vialii TaxID=182163 RepID=UPI00265E13ED|nr:protein ROOT HAIR DEFECTIVE 3-like [Rhododendron vialii]
MDVEGSDGRERKDDTAFERRSGLFAFAVSHIVLINMFANSVGLEHGASKPLLTHVFQGVLRLSTCPRKTTLMFVIRDIVETTPLDNLDPILRDDIQKIWNSIPKLEGQKGTPLSTFFNIEVVGLPNYVEKRELFKKQVKILRQRLNHSIPPGGLAGDSRQRIPGSDFSVSAQVIWENIKKDRELDLPKYEVMVAKIRCEEIFKEKLKDFVANKERRQLEEGAKTNIPAKGFGKDYDKIIDSYLKGYDKGTEYYDADVRSEKREHLKKEMMLVVQLAFQPILANIGSTYLMKFKEAFRKALKKGKNAEKAAHNCKETYLKLFDDTCADVIVEEANCNTKEERKKLKREIHDIVRQVERKLNDKKEKEKIIVAGAGGAVMATGVIVAAATLSAIFFPATALVAASTGAAFGLTALVSFAEKRFKSYKSKNCEISIEFEASNGID